MYIYEGMEKECLAELQNAFTALRVRTWTPLMRLVC
jgi:hypothetical protein